MPVIVSRGVAVNECDSFKGVAVSDSDSFKAWLSVNIIVSREWL